MIIALSCSTSDIAASLHSWMLISMLEFRSFSLLTSSLSRALPVPISASMSWIASATCVRCIRSDALCPVRILSMSI